MEVPAGTLQRIAIGEHAAFELVVGVYWEPLTRYLMSTTNDKWCVADILQETALRLWTNAHRVPGEEQGLAHWLFRVAKNIRVDFWRKLKPEKVTPMDPQDLFELANASVHTHEDEICTAMELAELFGRMTSKERACLELRLKGYSYEQIADRLGIPKGTVKSRMNNAKKSLERTEAPPERKCKVV